MRSAKLKVAGAALVLVMGALAGVAYAQAVDDSDTGVLQPNAGAGVQAAAIGTQQFERKFVPIAPCRVADTRGGTSPGKIQPNSVKGFDAFGGNLSAQGGSGSGCGIPSYAEALEMNITAVDPDGTGFLRGAAQNSYLILNGDPGTSQTLPNATLVNYSTALNASNAVTLPLCYSSGGFTLFACSGGKEFRLGAFTEATHVVVDAVGYYLTPVFAEVDALNNDLRIVRSNGVTSVTKDGTGFYSVTTARDMRGCPAVATLSDTDDADGLNFGYAVVDGTSATDYNVFTLNEAGASEDNEFTIVFTC